MAFFSVLASQSSKSSKSTKMSSNDTDITWHPGTWIRKPLDCLFFKKQINLYYHHAIAISDEYIIEVGVVDGESKRLIAASKSTSLIGQGFSVIIKVFERVSNYTVPNGVRNLIEEYCFANIFDINGECCVSRIESKKDWQVYRQPKSFIDGVIIVNRALDDVDKPIEYKLTSNNCEVYVNRWWNQKIVSHQMKSTIKWCGLAFLGCILSAYTFMIREGNGYKAKACEAAKGMFIHVANELKNEGAGTAQIKALQTAADNINRVLYFYIYTQPITNIELIILFIDKAVDQLQQIEKKLTDIVCAENPDIGMDGQFDDISEGLKVDAEELREFVKGVKTLWKMKKGAILYILYHIHNFYTEQ